LRPNGIILVVEDDLHTRGLLELILEDAGYAVCVVESAEAALEITWREQPRLIVTDVHLPGMSGYELCHRTRERYGHDVPIVMISGERTDTFDRVAGLLIGADDYLVKPFAVDEFLARVRRLADRPLPMAHVVGSRLTPRELEILRLLACGRDPLSIAGHLVISPKTVATHVEHIFSKLGVHSRAEAVALAFREDLVASSEAIEEPLRFRLEKPSHSPSVGQEPALAGSEPVPGTLLAFRGGVR
jgi:DNA-binding NarL/FixJ family response regulator